MTEEKSKKYRDNAMIKSLAKFQGKKHTCPECGGKRYFKFNRSNYPYGKKSKYVKTSGMQCKDCNYIKYDKSK